MLRQTIDKELRVKALIAYLFIYEQCLRNVARQERLNQAKVVLIVQHVEIFQRALVSDVKTWTNGSTVEKVYQTTTACKAQGKDSIGMLKAREVCDCYGIVDNCYMVCYKVDGTAAKKVGFVKYSGGVKP